MANLMFLPSGQAEDGLPERFPPRQAKPDFFPASGKRGTWGKPRNAVRNGVPMYSRSGGRKHFQIVRRS